MLEVSLGTVLTGVYAANKSGSRLEAIESVEIAARYGIQTQYTLRKMKSLTAVCSNPPPFAASVFFLG